MAPSTAPFAFTREAELLSRLSHPMTFTSGATVSNLWKVKNQISSSMGPSYPNPVPTGIDIKDNVSIEISPGGTAAENTTTGEKDRKILKFVVKAGSKIVMAP